MVMKISSCLAVAALAIVDAHRLGSCSNVDQIEYRGHRIIVLYAPWPTLLNMTAEE